MQVVVRCIVSCVGSGMNRTLLHTFYRVCLDNFVRFLLKSFLVNVPNRSRILVKGISMLKSLINPDDG